MRAVSIVGLVLGLVATPAAAISVANGADLFNGNSLVARGQFTGVVGLQVQSNAGLAASCTGTMIGSNTVLTAAHCLTLDGSGIRATRIVMPDLTVGGGGALTGTTIAGVKYYIAPGWNGVQLHGSDLAIIKLGAKVADGTTLYKAATGSVASNLGTEELVGLGTIGTGALGVLGFDGKKRYGFNQYEFTFDQVLAAAGFGTPAVSPTDVFGALKGTELAYDFDNGLAANDVFGRYMGTPGLGYVAGPYRDSMATAGDSGAPHFENGRIVGVTSFGISGALFEHGSCGLPTSVDPSHSATSCTNSSFGEIGVNTRVAAFGGFIASHVPEPASWTLMIGGFGVVGSAWRRQRPVAAR